VLGARPTVRKNDCRSKKRARRPHGARPDFPKFVDGELTDFTPKEKLDDSNFEKP